ncbi:MAG: inositol monophosphatase [Bacilli bacterium]|nr:inositol monophosphatase [Bacilli bacterium]
MNDYLEFAKGIAYYAGDLMKKYFDGDIKIEFKSDKTPVTEADKIINHYLIEKVKTTYPEHGVYGEEETFNKDNNRLWVCDPIDGTSGFTRHVPISVFSLAYVEKGVPLVGVVYNPFLDEMYTAIKGEGAFCNGKSIHVNNLDYGDIGCSVDYCMWNHAKYDTLDIVRLIRKNVKTCQVGSVAHACMLVASGKISAEIFPGTTHANCDMAASKLIVEEAGGLVTDFHGNEQDYSKDLDGALASNKVIHQKLLLKMKETYL